MFSDKLTAILPLTRNLPATMRPRVTVCATGLALALATGLFYTPRLDYAPIYLAYDEVMFGLQSHSLRSTGADLTGQRMPLFLSEPSFKAGRDPLSIYATALLLRYLPLSESTIRLPTALVGVVDVLAIWLLARRMFRKESLALVAAALLALTPAHFIYSRMAVDVVYPLPFTIAWLLCLLIFLERERLAALFAGGVALGVGIYSYLGFLAMTPVYLALTGYALLPRKSVTPYVIAAAGFSLLLLPLIAWHIQHPGRYADLVGGYRLYDPHLNPLQGAKDLSSYFSLSVRSGVYWDFFNPSFLFFAGDSSLINSTREVGVFLLPLLVLLPLGIYQILACRRTRFNILLVLGLATGPLAATLLATVEIRRAMVMIPFAILIATFGVERLVTAPRRVWRVAALVLLLFAPIQFRRFYVDYFTDYRLRSSLWFGGNIRDAIAAMIQRAHQPGVPLYLSNRIPYVDANWQFYSIKLGRTDLSTRTVYYDPERLDVRALPAGTLLLSPAGETATEPALKADGWRTVDVITEPNGFPSFVLHEK